jgi:Zn-dependent protease with chaperone function
MLLAACIALVPAIDRLWSGRRLRRLLDDPALAERLLASRRFSGLTIGLPLGTLIYWWPRHLPWTLPLLIVARMTAAYPLRKALYQETWPLGAYLSFFLRLAVGVYGFWIVLAFTPSIVALGGRFGWLVAGLLALTLTLWNIHYADTVRLLVRARPVNDAALVARFRGLAAAAAIPAPRFDYIDVSGGVLANAVALPSLRGNGVLVSSTLLERLDPDEVVAICAHEIAHFDHLNGAHLRRLNLVTYALIAGGVLSPMLWTLFPAADYVVTAVWGLALLAGLAMRARHRQKNETASDLRAVTLTGDPEALVRALTTLHAIARVPRRWEADFERRATHPSLARRIQAIRGADATRAASHAVSSSPGASSGFTSPDGSSSVIFHPDRMEWNEGNEASYSLMPGYRAPPRSLRSIARAAAGRFRSASGMWHAPRQRSTSSTPNSSRPRHRSRQPRWCAFSR